MKAITDEELACLRECATVEFKSALGRDRQGEVPRSVWDTYSAMANTNGGTILLGAQEGDDGRPVFIGVPNVQRVVKDFWTQINNPQTVNENILRDEDVSVRIMPNGVSIIVIQVPIATRGQRPIYVGTNPYSGTFRRLHEGDFRCSKLLVERMLVDHGSDTLDAEVLPDSSLDDVDAETLQTYRRRFELLRDTHPFISLSDEEFLTQLNGFRRNARTGEAGLTLAGLLMFGRLSSILRLWPGYIVDYREYGTNPGITDRWTDRVTTDFSWPGNLFCFCRIVLERLYRGLKIPFALTGDMIRENHTPVHIALREAVVNALIHADYGVGRAVLITKRPDAYEFVNPGLSRVATIQVLNGGLANSDCRNRTLQKMFQMIGFAEQAGSGFPKIFEGWAVAGWERPTFSEDIENNTFTLLMPRSSSESITQGNTISHMSVFKLKKHHWTVLFALENEKTLEELLIAVKRKDKRNLKKKTLIPLCEQGLIEISTGESETPRQYYRLTSLGTKLIGQQQGENHKASERTTNASVAPGNSFSQ